MALPVLSVSEDDIAIALRAWLLLATDNSVEVIQGQDNRVPEPKADDFIVFTFMNRRRTSTNVDTWDTSGVPLQSR